MLSIIMWHGTLQIITTTALAIQATAAFSAYVGERLKVSYSLYVSKYVYFPGLLIIMLVIVMTLHISMFPSCLTVAQLLRPSNLFTDV